MTRDIRDVRHLMLILRSDLSALLGLMCFALAKARQKDPKAHQ
ncbi:hypothetical protein [Vibrio alginolyticus]|nr:hypothetical protein [Vibrio alginolyticus]